MIDKERRKKLAFHLRQLSVGLINWKQMPPYPNFEEDQMDTIPHRLEFRYYPEKNLIDSTVFLSKRKH